MDHTLLLALNQLAGHGPAADSLLVHLSGTPLAKGMPVMMLFWGLWMARDPGRTHRRAGLTATLVAAMAALALGRLLAVALPFRLRPLHDPDIVLRGSEALDPMPLDGWSSMPSDHALLFFTLATGIALVHRGWGAVALLHAALVIAMPRIVLGLHWPSDIALGALMGIALALLLVPPLRAWLEKGPITAIEARAGLFYPALFLLTSQTATMFDWSRALVSGIMDQL